MIKEKRVLAVVPARGGSKGIKLKNLQLLAGLPLIAHVAKTIRHLPEIDRAVVSTDHEEIAKLAEEAGLSAAFRRPENLSGDYVADYEVLTHALNMMEKIDAVQYDIILMLQPTSPLRRLEDVRAALKKLIFENRDAVWTVSETDSKVHPLKQLLVSEKGDLDYYDEAGKMIIARQQLNPVYHRNGIAYAVTRDCLINQKTIKGKNTAALITKNVSISIDTELDMKLAEFFLTNTLISEEQ